MKLLGVIADWLDRRSMHREQRAEYGRPTARAVTLTTAMCGDDGTFFRFLANDFAIPLIDTPSRLFNVSTWCEYRATPDDDADVVASTKSGPVAVIDPASRSAGGELYVALFVESGEAPPEWWCTFEHDYLVRWCAEFDLDDKSRWRVRTDSPPELVRAGRA